MLYALLEGQVLTTELLYVAEGANGQFRDDFVDLLWGVL